MNVCGRRSIDSIVPMQFLDSATTLYCLLGDAGLHRHTWDGIHSLFLWQEFLFLLFCIRDQCWRGCIKRAGPAEQSYFEKSHSSRYEIPQYPLHTPSFCATANHAVCYC